MSEVNLDMKELDEAIDPVRFRPPAETVRAQRERVLKIARQQQEVPEEDCSDTQEAESRGFPITLATRTSE